MIWLNNFHNAIDELFKDRKANERIIFYATPFLLFAFLSYKFLIPISEKKIADKKNTLNGIRAEITTTQDYLKRKNEIFAEMAQTKEINKALLMKLQNQIAQNNALQNSMLSVDFINMSERNILDFVDEMAVASGKHGISITSLTTALAEKQNGVFKKELAVDIECNGQLSGILGFINSIEGSKMFSKINSVSIEHGKKLNAKINLVVSGL
jgi:hypothetical protein